MKDNLASIKQRADSYKLLSECYYLPDDELMQRVIDISQRNHFFAELTGHLPPSVELESLQIDYTRLFVGPFKLLAPPYGSVYLEDNRVMGDSTLDVRSCYESEGMDIVIKEAPDHIAVELEFIYYLVVKQMDAISEGNLQKINSYQHKQYYFLSTHPARWVPEFAENVQKNAQTEFYRKLAKLTDMFIQKDKDNCSSYSPAPSDNKLRVFI